jgi:GNAT superfamily N-acetyltransferase
MTFATRLAALADHALCARLFVELRVEGDPTLTREEFAALLLPRVCVIEQGDEPIGYAGWHSWGDTGNISQVVVDPRARNRGAGRALVEDVQERLIQLGCRHCHLHVKKDNAAAIRLYQRCGFAIEREGWSLEFAWSQIARLPGASAVACLMSATEDLEFATRLGVGPERLAFSRSRAGVSLVGLRELGEPVGFVSFHSSWGTGILRLVRPELVRPLLEKVREYATGDRIQIFVEEDRPLADLLLAAGAGLNHATYRMGKPLV